MKNRDILKTTRGGRVSLWGYRLFYVGFAAIFVGGWLAGYFHAPRPVMVAVAVVTFGTAIAGLFVARAGRRMDDRAMAEYKRKVATGELPKWKPGDPDPLADR